MKLDYRLGLDLGTNSIGWCVYLLDEEGEPFRIKRLGSRIFQDGRDPQNLASLAAERRKARQARRRRDRVLKRRQRFMDELIQFGLMPSGEDERKALQPLDPYVLRARGLDEELKPYEFGRALYHLARKRGFKSSRKDARDKDAEKEAGKVHTAIASLTGRIAAAGCRTVGEYLARQRGFQGGAPNPATKADTRENEKQKHVGIRARRGSDGNYVLYLHREMISDEFEKLWEAQRNFHPDLLTPTAKDCLLDTLLFQRRLLPVNPGHCLFEPDEMRWPLCSPMQQRFRILQELNNLRIGTDVTDQRVLTLEERNCLLNLLLHATKDNEATFAKLRSALGFGRPARERFNLESKKRRGLKPDVVGTQFSSPDALGDEWYGLKADVQDALALLVERADRYDELYAALLTLPSNLERAEYVMRPRADERFLLEALAGLPLPLNESQAKAISHIQLPEGYGSLSRKALNKVVPELKREVVTYDTAIQAAGYTHHSMLHTGELYEKLPYYGKVLSGYTSGARPEMIEPKDHPTVKGEKQYGKIPNPTVHVGLTQLRLLVNEIVRRYGRPREIVVELAREFGLSGQHRRDLEKQQTENQQRNERYDAELARLGQRTNYENRLKLRLWDQLGAEDAMDRYCIYSGTRLNKTMLFSDEVEIDHVLPFSRSLHDGIGNKILCTRQANRDKGNRTPFEAFRHSPRSYSWEGILDRVERYFTRSEDRALRSKAALFAEDAMERFLGERDFLSRHLTDTAYFSRVAKQYLSYVCHPDDVWVSTGRLTGMLRGKWNLNPLLSASSKKNREDHRHHALDAAVIGLCSRSLIQRMSNAAQNAEQLGENRLLAGLDLPWPNFQNELHEALERVVVSHKPDHGRQAALHDKTNYGKRGEADSRGAMLVKHHVILEDLKSTSVSQIDDVVLRGKIGAVFRKMEGAKPAEIKAALSAFGRESKIRRVQVSQRLSVISIKDRRNGLPYRYVKGNSNYCYEIVRLDGGRWGGNIVSTFDANKSDYRESRNRAQNGEPLVMRLHRGDILVVEGNGKRRIMRIATIKDGQIALAEHFEANVDARVRKKAMSYMLKSPNALRDLKARLVGVDPLGFVNDPGYRES